MTSPSTLKAGVLCPEPLLSVLVDKQSDWCSEASFLGECGKYSQNSAVEYFNILWPEFYALRLKFTHYKNLDLFLFVL